MAKELGEVQDDNVLQEMIERADFDQDGLVSEEEFYNLLTKKAYWIWSITIVISNYFSCMSFTLKNWSHNTDWWL